MSVGILVPDLRLKGFQLSLLNMFTEGFCDDEEICFDVNIFKNCILWAENEVFLVCFVCLFFAQAGIHIGLTYTPPPNSRITVVYHLAYVP